MTINDFSRLLKEFAERPLPATALRHVYLWHQDPQQLSAIIPAQLAVNLDLYILAGGLPRHPYAQDEARRQLQDAIRRWLAVLIANESPAKFTLKNRPPRLVVH